MLELPAFRTPWALLVAGFATACGGKVVISTEGEPDAAGPIDGAVPISDGRPPDTFTSTDGGVDVASPLDAPTLSGFTGTVKRWAESHCYIWVDQDKVETGRLYTPGALLVGFWSIAHPDTGSGYFYAETDNTRVAVAHGVSSVREIRDASQLEYTDYVTDMLYEGTLVVFRTASHDMHLAVRVDDIYPGEKWHDDPPDTPGEYAYADITWYLQPDGSGDFSGF